MDRIPIGQENCGTAEIAIMVEAGTIVREMGMITTISEEIPATWWLEHKSYKYILSVLVLKNNKDISTQPTKLPLGPT
jgi:hypothetical protein